MIHRSCFNAHKNGEGGLEVFRTDQTFLCPARLLAFSFGLKSPTAYDVYFMTDLRTRKRPFAMLPPPETN